jgi:hypothetical protein
MRGDLEDLAIGAVHEYEGGLIVEDGHGVPAEFTLDNGLRVVLSRDASAPVVAVNLWYNVGSRNERPGRTGFAHLFEHMMFQGSENVPEMAHFCAHRAGGRLAERLDLAGPHELLRDAACAPAGAGPVAGKSDRHGLPAAGDDAGEAGQPA